MTSEHSEQTADAGGVVATTTRAVSVIVPTYREVENVPELIARLDRVRADHALGVELIFVDDDSGDGIERVVAANGSDWARTIVRRGERGLASAVMHGITRARHETIVVMDADLSHPPESIPALLNAIDSGAEFAIGSRFVQGGSTDAAWTLPRRINSALATLLARPLASIRDPMAGFFAFRKPLFHRASPLKPVGYKIALELIVRSRATRIVEVPIHFTERRKGRSKLTLAVRLAYLRQLAELMFFRLFSGRRRSNAR